MALPTAQDDSGKKKNNSSSQQQKQEQPSSWSWGDFAVATTAIVGLGVAVYKVASNLKEDNSKPKHRYER